MGVDYSTTVAYGLALTEIPEVMGLDEYADDDEFQEWLDAHGYTHIEYECGGNFMTGEHIHLFAVRGTVARLDPMYDEGYRSFEDNGTPVGVLRELYTLCEQFELPWPSSISWKLTFNVS